jgi:hypothetical protein
MIPLAGLEEIIDASGIAPRIEDMLPAGVRARQLAVRTLLLGMMITLADGRPAHLTRVHQALAGLPEPDAPRLGHAAGERCRVPQQAESAAQVPQCPGWQ